MVAALMSSLQQSSWGDVVLSNCFNQSYHGWLLLQKVELVGFVLVSYQMDECQLLNLAVAKAWQGQGRGSNLLRHVIKSASREGLARIVLEVRVSNQAAIALYQRHGFREMGRRKNYYPTPDGSEDALLMELAC